MSYNHLQEYYGRKIAAFRYYFGLTNAWFGMEDIHQLRVTMKELRAFWLLVENCSDQYKKKDHYDLLVNLFKKAGKVREIQVNMEMVKDYKYSFLDAYIDHQDVIVKSAVKDMLEIMISFDAEKHKKLDKALNGILQSMPEVDILNSCIEIIDYKYQNVKKRMRHLPDNKILHKIRMDLKIVKEIFQFMQSLNVNGITGLQEHNNRLCKHLGIWHDHVDLYTSLKKFDTQNMKNKDVKKFRKFASRIRKVRDKKQVKIIRQLKKYNMHGDIKLLKKILKKRIAII